VRVLANNLGLLQTLDGCPNLFGCPESDLLNLFAGQFTMLKELL
jgi:hypothetical protein